MSIRRVAPSSPPGPESRAPWRHNDEREGAVGSLYGTNLDVALPRPSNSKVVRIGARVVATNTSYGPLGAMAFDAAVTDLRAIRRQMRSIGVEIGMEREPASLEEALAMLSIAKKARASAEAERDAAVAGREADQEQYVLKQRECDARHRQALRISDTRGRSFTGSRRVERSHRMEGGGGDALPGASLQAALVAPKPASYAVYVTTHQVYVDKSGRVGRCVWKNVAETLTISITDPAMTEESRPAFVLFIGGITSAPTERFNADTVKISPLPGSDARSVEAVGSRPGTADTYHLAPTTGWERGGTANEWVARFELRVLEDSGKLGSSAVPLEFGARPAVETLATFQKMHGGGDVQAKFQTDNPFSWSNSVIVRNESYGPKGTVVSRIAQGDRSVIGYNTDAIYRAMKATAPSTSEAAMM